MKQKITKLNIVKQNTSKYNIKTISTETKCGKVEQASVRNDVCSTSSHSAKCYVWLEGLVIEHRS